MILQKNAILFQDDYIIAIDKPVDLPVHKNDFMPVDSLYLTKLVGEICGKSVYPVHRLDSKTSGVILLAFSREVAAALSKQFEQREVKKSYIIICKDKPGEGSWNGPVLIKKKKKRVSALTRFTTIKSVDTFISYKKVVNVGLSLVKAYPETGRWHQLRQHFSFKRFDILGDTQHGDWTLNRIMTEHTGVKRLLLHASSLTFRHPDNGEEMSLKAPLPDAFEQVLNQLKGVELKFEVD